MALDATSSVSPVNSLVPVEPVQQGTCVTVRRPSRGSKHGLPFRSEHQTGSPHSVTHPLRNRMKVFYLLVILLYGT